MSCDSALTRLPLAGVSIHSYDNHFRGQATKTINILSRLALLIIGSLLIVNIFPTMYAMHAVAGLTGGLFLSFIAGSNNRRCFSEIFLESIIASVCLTMVILAGQGLTYVQSGIGMVAAIGAGLLIAIPAEKGHVQEVFPQEPYGWCVKPKNEHEIIPILPVRVIDYVVGVTRDLTISTISIFSGLINRHKYRDQIVIEECNALCVLIHGLASRPAVLDDYHRSIASLNKGITIFQPFVTNNGQCSLREAENSIKEQILNWTKVYPEKPIIMIGHSNGARIAGSISNQLKFEGAKNPMHVHCVAGPFYGTEFVNRPSWFECAKEKWSTLFRKIYSDAVFEELSYESFSCKPLISAMLSASHEYTELNYYFYATPSDALVFPYNSALPYLFKGKYFLAHGEGHQGILSSVHDTIIRKIECLVF